MKKGHLLLIAILGCLTFFSSCHKDEPVLTFDGTWMLQSADVKVYDSHNQLTNQFNIPITQYAEKNKLEIQFKGDKIKTQVDAHGNAAITTLTYRIDGNKILVKASADGPENLLGEYTLTEENFTLKTAETSPDGTTEALLVYRHK
ncbi:hypothetical protein C3K47_15280 [Solitalea longa]|uniref:Lipocalin-like domain-containing protein n=1 Tax=Solitalea longa TaxID=2079460 RepID=A0A2S4ZYJ9_9SPHI|nr:hypothetical protein [Solitalea longa]POY35421.1 hypothetical protein C3K47_15280 [Solitalea longa]